MAEDEYEVIPHKLLADLKYDVEALKKQLSHPDAKINELVLEIESLKDDIHELHTIFQRALDEAKEEDISKTVFILKEKMETIARQNETIAQGMVAISDKVEDWMAKQSATRPALQIHQPMPRQMSQPMSQPMQNDFGRPSMPGPARMAPLPRGMPPGQVDLPPPPPGRERKSLAGLFG